MVLFPNKNKRNCTKCGTQICDKGCGCDLCKKRGDDLLCIPCTRNKAAEPVVEASV